MTLLPLSYSYINSQLLHQLQYVISVVYWY
jgi:hypothetical protein